MIMYRVYSILVILGVGMFSALALASASADPQAQVVVQLKWSHQFQFAGFYAAKELGYYREAGLHVTIKERDFETPVLDAVLSGNAQFGVADATLILHRLKGLPVVALFASYQYSPLILITRAQDNIINPRQLKNKRIMFQHNADDSTLLALFNQFDISLSDIAQVNVSSPRAALLNHQIDAYSGYITNQPYQHQESDMAINIINPANYGIDFIGDLIYTSEAYLAHNKQQAADFRRATIKGWQYALANPEQVIDWIIDTYHPAKSKSALMSEAKITKTLFDADLSKVGYISPRRLQRVAEMYKELNLAPAQSNLNGFELDFYDQRPSPYWLVAIASGLVLITLWLILYGGRRQASAMARRVIVLFSKTALIETKHQQMIEQNVLSFRTDMDDCFAFVSPAFCRKMGYDRADLIGRPRSALYHPKFPSPLIVQINKSMAARVTWAGEMMYCNKQGSLLWHRTQLDPIVCNDYLLGYSAVEYDISDHKRLEQSIVTDGATGLFNRFKLEQLIHYERNRSVRTRRSCSILLFNLGGLRSARANEGVQAVNNLLLAVANVVNHDIRISDSAGRWDTDRLLVICPETSVKGAYVLGEKIAASIESAEFSPAIALTVNIAVGQLNKDESVAQLIGRIELQLQSA